MDDTPILSDNKGPVSAGLMLAQAREAQGKRIDEVSRELNLSPRLIATIESDQLDGLPEPTYVRGYIGSYSRLLGLDTQEVLAQFSDTKWLNSDRRDHQIYSAFEMDEGETESRRIVPWVMTILLVLALAAIVYLGFFTSLWDELLGDQDSIPVPQIVAADSVDVEAIPTSDSQTSALPTQAPPSPVAETIADMPASEEGVMPAVTRLTLRFSDSCWVDIRDDQNKRLVYRTYAAGQQVTVEHNSWIDVFLAQAQGVEAELNGQTFDLAPYVEGVYAKFKVGE